ncbi:MAG: hypothetical protein QOF49_1708 [Chloroflexota bacterium]|nr:hypothetical protein [Chloroflexota bacterium]
MTAADAVLVLGWLVLAHLVADFVVQTGSIAAAKSGHGLAALGGLVAHGALVALCVAPVAWAYGDRGWWFVIVTAVSHMAIDRSKIVLTRRAAASALRDAHRRHEGPEPADHLGRAWTARPAALFLADQGAHLAVVGGGWAVLLAGVPLTPAWTTAIDGWLGGWDGTAVHGVVAAAVVVVALVIVNTRAASLFVGILVRPVEIGVAADHRWGSRVAPPAEPAADVRDSARTATARRRWSIRLGPLDAHVTSEPEPEPEPEPVPELDPEPGSGRKAEPPPAPVDGSARVGSTIGMLERILIVVFVLTGTESAIGFVVAAKTLARFRLLDDRAFAEYYLLGTLASVAVAIVSGLIGRAALAVMLGAG